MLRTGPGNDRRIAISQKSTNIPRKSMEQKGHVNGTDVVRFAVERDPAHVRNVCLPSVVLAVASHVHRHNDVVCSL